MGDDERRRGRINAVTYGVDLSRPADDDVVDIRARELIRQRLFLEPVDAYFDAITEALESADQIAGRDGDEDVVRDFLTRLRDALESRRPWPQAPYLYVEPAELPRYGGVTVIARLPLREADVRARTNLYFNEAASGGRILILRLRTGQIVVLRASADLSYRGVELLAETEDSAATIAAFRELAGFTEEEVVPV